VGANRRIPITFGSPSNRHSDARLATSLPCRYVAHSSSGVHWASDEVAWWKQSGIDALEAAHKLWRETHTVLYETNEPRDVNVNSRALDA
jgi:hypothetical protein